MYTSPGETPRSASDTVYLTLKRRILDGALAGGDMLGEQAVADELGVSRTPVREAIGRLQAEGWLKVHPRRGAVIAAPGPDERADVLDARALLETYGVRTAIARGTTVELTTRLREVLDGQVEAHDRGDLEQVAALDAAFHAALVAAAGNAVLDAAFATIRDRQERMTTRALWRRVDVGARVLAEHDEIVQLIAAGDADGFASTLDRHMHQVHG
ncbi:MAG: GntR family transcriptional regulator [Actinobacteria bacterium]|nr:GntR family transcriptional regulator [Actinomycetota bacterium]